MYYRHDLDYVYPDRCDQHMIDVPHLRDVTVDENYPFIDNSFRARCLHLGYTILNRGVISWLLYISHCLKVHGRENLRNNKKLLQNGPITISNHVFYWDFCCLQKVMGARQCRFPAWQTNLEGPNGPLIRVAGGIPIPENNMKALKKFKATMDGVLESKTWLHFYPEGSMWMYYPDVRPFKKAVFQYAVRYDKPIIPMGFSFRPRKGITRLFTKVPAVDLNIGAPIYPDKSLSPVEAARKMQKQAYHVVQELCGITPGHPSYRVDQDPANYQKTM